MMGLKTLALVLLARRDLAAAESAATAALALARELDDRAREAGILHNLGLIRASAGDVAGARTRLASSLEIRHEIGRADETATTLAFLAAISNLQGDVAAADAAILESLLLGREVKDRRVGWTLEILASRLAAEQPDEALRLSGAAAALHARIGSRPPATWKLLVENALGPAREALGEPAAAVAVAEGGRMSFDEALEYALTQAQAAHAGAR
jgi:hypothetical protein